MHRNGILTISLDYELFWGVRDKRTIEQYYDNLSGVKSSIEKTLALFEKYEIHATWATVGFIFAEDEKEALKFSPKLEPAYEDKNLSPYRYLNSYGKEERALHFAPESITRILESKHQEIGTHTFSHYYCMEEGQTIEQFEEDLKAGQEIAKKFGQELKSLVFPRNQYNSNYIGVMEKLNISSFRGNEKSKIYEEGSSKETKLTLTRALRLVDQYANMTGDHTYTLEEMSKQYPYNIPSSRFLRPYSKKLKSLDGLRLRRIKRSILQAAKKNELFHLWWHPHNLGVNQEENFAFLEEILKYYKSVQDAYGMQSLNMQEVSGLLDEVNGRLKNGK